MDARSATGSSRPEDQLHALLREGLPCDSREMQLLIALLARTAGRPGGAKEVAQAVGLPSRHKLLRILRKRGLGSLTQVAAWVRVLSWTLDVERSGRSLLSLALAEGADPAERYKTIQRTVGLGWREVHARGSAWVVQRLHDRYLGYQVQGFDPVDD